MEDAKMLCPYCSAVFTPEMMIDYLRISDGCDTCGYGAKTKVFVEIKCEKCNKIIYKKETLVKH